MPCLADVSVSIHTFNNQEDLTTSISFDSGISCIGELLDSDNINMMEAGSVTGSGSSKLDYLNPFDVMNADKVVLMESALEKINGKK